MSTPAAATPSPAVLCKGTAIEYKAFKREFFEGEGGVLVVTATCYYPTSGFTVFFEEDSGKLKLMERAPSGIVPQLVTYYAACWPSNGVPGLSNVPSHVTITDGQGDHKIHVKTW